MPIDPKLLLDLAEAASPAFIKLVAKLNEQASAAALEERKLKTELRQSTAQIVALHDALTKVSPDNSALVPVHISRLTRDLAQAAGGMTANEARYLVDAYYTMQEDRKRYYHQDRSITASGEPSSVILWFAIQSERMEDQIKKALDAYTAGHPMGAWMRSVVGIGPVISAGLLAHIDIKKAPTAGHIWQFAGIAGDNQRPWLKGQKRPFNAKLKTLLWKVGQSFMKNCNKDGCYYGQVYKLRKEFENNRNNAGGNKARAAELLPKFSKDTEAYKAYAIGKLPPAQIDARARRYAVKLFVSHMHDAWFRQAFGHAPLNPWPLGRDGHTHIWPIAPNVPLETSQHFKEYWESLARRSAAAA
jgi:hypothetical protein